MRLPPEARTRAFRLATRFDRDRLEPLLRRADAVASGPVKVAGGLGVGLLLDVPVSHVQLYHLLRGGLETPVQEAMRRHVTPGSVVLDVGANLGFFALIAWRLGARVEAFEPEPDNVRALRRNVALNGADVGVHAVAAGAAAGRGTFLRVDEASWSHLADRGRHERTVGDLEVDVVALDDLELDAARRVSFVKIDVEGSELSVLEGASRLIAAHRPALLVELHGTRDEVLAWLGAHGYDVVENVDGPEPASEAGDVHLLARSSASRS